MKEAERLAYDSRVHVIFQPKAWCDRSVIFLVPLAFVAVLRSLHRRLPLWLSVVRCFALVAPAENRLGGSGQIFPSYWRFRNNPSGPAGLVSGPAWADFGGICNASWS